MTPTPSVVIVEYDATWPARFDVERARLRHLLRPLSLRIEHIGSTAVPGLAAKPIIDIMIGCASLAEFQPFIAALEADDWRYVLKYEDVMPFRRFLGKPAAGERRFNLHVVEVGCDFWREHLLFRDHLRRNAETAATYERLKRELAAKHSSDREAYTDAKGPFICSVVEAAKRAAV